MKKMITTCFIAMSLTFIAVKPQKSEAAIIFVTIAAGTSYVVETATNSQILAGIVGIGAAFASYNFVVKVVNNNWTWWNTAGTYVNLLVFNEEVDARNIDTVMTKMFPEVNDMSVIKDLSDAVLAEYESLPADGAKVEVRVSPEMTKSILERSDLSSKQIQNIVLQLN